MSKAPKRPDAVWYGLPSLIEKGYEELAAMSISEIVKIRRQFAVSGYRDAPSWDTSRWYEEGWDYSPEAFFDNCLAAMKDNDPSRHLEVLHALALAGDRTLCDVALDELVGDLQVSANEAIEDILLDIAIARTDEFALKAIEAILGSLQTVPRTLTAAAQLSQKAMEVVGVIELRRTEDNHQ